MNDPKIPFDSVEARWPVEVQWGDCDPAGIIFYPTYFRWMDSATWAFLAFVGYPPQRMRAERRTMPLVSADCQFIAAARQGDRCEARSRIARFGGKSFVVAHEFLREDGTLLAKGTETRVWARLADAPGAGIKSEDIPPEIRALFRAPQRA